MSVARPRRWLPRRSLALVAGATSALALAACGDSGASSSAAGGGGTSSGGAPSGLQLTAKNLTFSPTSFTVPGGGQVSIVFKNQDQVEHSFTSAAAKVDQDVDGGETRTVTFTAPQSGTLQFKCKYHPTTMNGTITVGPGGGGAAPSSPASSGYGGY